MSDEMIASFGSAAWIARQAGRPLRLLALTIVIGGALSAFLVNDIVVFAMTPLLCAGLAARKLDARPFLFGLAAASNAGSAATLIGNPQNMLIGASLSLDFGAYARIALPVVVPGLVATWAWIAWRSRGRWQLAQTRASDAPGRRLDDDMPFDAWQTAKGLGVAAILLALFVWSTIPREVAALTGAGLLLMSRRLHSTKMLGLVDWELLVLFIGLFVVNRAFQDTGLVAQAVTYLGSMGVALERPVELFVASFALSNVVSNVPAVMLLLPLATDPLAGPILALASTLAGNLLIVGSIANIIVVDAARRRGIAIDWRTHARTGVPVALVTLCVTAVWFALRH